MGASSPSGGGGGFKVKAVWCGSLEAGRTRDSVAEYVDRMHRAGINTIAVHLKGGDGLLYWPSRLHPEAVAPGYQEFDLPAALLSECRKRGMAMHAWFIDYYEGEQGAAYRAHPEWAALDAQGRPTSEETLRGQRYSNVWMCPARRPGYTDQWLVPLYREFAEMYAVDALHHDYIRYPGDLAPDQYCFCDHCLEEMPRFNGFYAEAYPREPFYHELYDRPYLEAHWEQSPTVLPANWDRLPRHMKSHFLLESGFFQGGRRDLDYFFYTYRTRWITQFARESAEAVRAARPGMEISAAVFKNPIHSGRFIGQDWRQFAPYVETCMPMDYRDHYPGSFETYLDLLEETIASQKVWARDYKRLWPGAAINFLFFEEERPLHALDRALRANAPAEARVALASIGSRLRSVAPELHDRLASWAATPREPERPALQDAFSAFLQHVPPAYWPAEKLTRTLDRIRGTGVEGVCLFCEGHLHQYGLWDTLADAFVS